MFDSAVKEKMNQLARKYDYDLVFQLWTRINKPGCLKDYFCKWRWKPDMTIQEGMDCLDDYFLGLEALLRKRKRLPAQARKRPVTKKSPGPLRVD